MKKILILPDAHITVKIPKPYQLVKKFVKDFKPDETILLGDFMDVESLSAWDMDKKRLMEGRRFQKEVDVANKELDYLQKYSKKITYLEGNHEWRIGRYLDKNPEMEGLLELPLKLNLDKRKIKFLPMNNLYKVGHMYFTHGMWVNKYHAQQHLTRLGCNVCYGHAHDSQTAMLNMKMQKPVMAYGLGCLCGHEPDYLKGRPASWLNQFAVMYLSDNGDYNIYPINIVNNKFIWNGRQYSI